MATFHVNEPFVIRLSENPTTGYQWMVDTTPGLEIVRSYYSHSCQPNMNGCGGTRTWVLRGIDRGEHYFIGKYRRPWEKEDVTPKILKVLII